MEEKFIERDIKAESILSYYGWDDFTVEMKGIFHRNYSPDIMSKLTDRDKIELSRDSLYHLLPENLFFNDDDFNNSEVLKEKKKKRKLFFQPFDNAYFNLSVSLEKEINNISEKHLRSMIDFFDGENFSDAEGVLLNNLNLSGFSSEIRGNERLIIDLLKIILDIKKIELIKNNDPACGELLKKTFVIHIPKLSTEEYFNKNHQVNKLFKILQEYFLPFDVEYNFKIKDRQQKFMLQENLILDYNTNI